MDIALINNCHKAGFGSIPEIKAMLVEYGQDWVQKLLRFRIIEQE